MLTDRPIIEKSMEVPQKLKGKTTTPGQVVQLVGASSFTPTCYRYNPQSEGRQPIDVSQMDVYVCLSVSLSLLLSKIDEHIVGED